MKRTALFIPIFIVLTVILSAGVAIGVYSLRVAAVQRGIARAMDRFATGETEKGFAQLSRIDNWAEQHPALIAHVRNAAIVGHVTSQNDEAAFVLAAREQANIDTPPPPCNIWQALYQVMAEQLDPIWLKQIGGRNPDPRRGFRTLLDAMKATGDAQRIAQLNARLVAHYGADELARILTHPSRRDSGMDTPIPPPDFGAGRFGVAAGASIRCYDEHGKHCGDLQPGSLVTVTETRDSNDGQMAVCIPQTTQPADPPILIHTRDLVIRQGNIAQLPAELRRLLAEHGRATSRLKQARRHAAMRNPHAQTYKAATTAYKTFIADVKRLVAARDKAEGDERTRYADQLQTMKNKAPGLRDAYETSKHDYEAWKNGHPDAINGDPEVKTQQQRVDETAQQIAPYFDS